MKIFQPSKRYSLLGFFIIFGILYQIHAQPTPTVTFEPPTVQLDATTTIQTLGKGVNSQIFVNDFYIIRRSATGGLMIWDVNTYELLYELFFGSAFYGTTVCKRFDMRTSQQTILHVLADTGQTLMMVRLNGDNTASLIKNITLNPSNAYYLNQVQDIQVTQHQVIILATSTIGTTHISQFTTADGAANPFITQRVSVLANPIYRVKTCELSSSSPFYYAVIWKNNCYFEALECTIGVNCVHMFYYESLNCDADDGIATVNTYKITFSQDCTQMIFHEKYVGARTFDMISKSFTNDYNSEPYTIADMVFTDSINYYMGLVQSNSTYLTYQHTPYLSGDEIATQQNSISFAGSLAEFSFTHLKFIVANNLNIYTYPLICQNSLLTMTSVGLCLECPDNCLDCNIDGECITCQDDYTLDLVSYTCEQDIITNGTTNSTNSTNSSTDDNDTDNSTSQNDTTNQTTDNDTNSSIIDNSTITPVDNQTDPQSNSTDGNDTSSNSTLDQDDAQTTTNHQSNRFYVQPIYPYQQTIGNFVREYGTQPIINFAVMVITIFKFLPLSFLFMRFISFWELCSYYLLPGVQLPQQLYQTLNIIYQGVTKPIFPGIGINIVFDIGLEDKVTGYLSENYGLSSDFIDTNFQNLVILVISQINLGLFYCLTIWLSKTNIIRRVLKNINYPLAFLGQFCAIMNDFFLNFSTLPTNNYQQNFNQKINITLQHIFISTATFATITVIYFIYKSKQQSSAQKYQQTRQWIFACLCTSIIPAMAVFNRVEVLLVGGALLFGEKCYSELTMKKVQINQVILTMELALFHFGFVILCLFDAKTYPIIFHHTGLVMILVLIFAGAHELLSFILEIVIQTYKALRKFFRSVSSQTTQSNQIKIKVRFDVKKQKQKTIKQIFSRNEFSSMENIQLHPMKFKKHKMQQIVPQKIQSTASNLFSNQNMSVEKSIIDQMNNKISRSKKNKISQHSKKRLKVQISRVSAMKDKQ